MKTNSKAFNAGVSVCQRKSTCSTHISFAVLNHNQNRRFEVPHSVVQGAEANAVKIRTVDQHPRAARQPLGQLHSREEKVITE